MLYSAYHTQDYVLRFRFNKEQLEQVVDMMKVILNSIFLIRSRYAKTGEPTDQLPQRSSFGAYLARASSSSGSSMRITPRPQPS